MRRSLPTSDWIRYFGVLIFLFFRSKSNSPGRKSPPNHFFHAFVILAVAVSHLALYNISSERSFVFEVPAEKLFLLKLWVRYCFLDVYYSSFCCDLLEYYSLQKTQPLQSGMNFFLSVESTTIESTRIGSTKYDVGSTILFSCCWKYDNSLLRVRCYLQSTILKVRFVFFLFGSTRIISMLEVRERKNSESQSIENAKKRFDVVFLYIYLFYSSPYFSTYLYT